MPNKETLKTTSETNKIEVSEAEEKDIARKYEEEGFDLGTKVFIYQGLVEKNRTKLSEQEEEINRIEASAQALDKSKEKLKGFLEKYGDDGTENKITDIDEQKERFLKKKEKIEGKMLKRTEKLEKSEEKRNKVLDKLYEKHEEKAVPLQEKVTEIKDKKEEIDLEVAVKKIKQREALEDLKSLEKERKDIIVLLREAGVSKKNINKNKGLITIEQGIEEIKSKISREKEEDKKRERKLQKELDKKEKKLKGYTDKQKEIVCIKEGRIYIQQTESTVRVTSGGEASETASSEKKDKFPLLLLLQEWNMQIVKEYKKAAVTINPEEFLQKVDLEEETVVRLAEFQDVLDKYYSFKKLPRDQYKSSIKSFRKK